MAQGVFPAGKLTPASSGLLSSVTVVEHSEGDERWANGPVSWDSNACPSELILADFCSNSDRGVIASTDVIGTYTWPFGIVTNYECLTPGLSVEERQRIAIAQLEAGTQKAVERELWAGQIAQASNRLDVPFLMDGQAVDLTGGASVSVAVGVAKLEQGLADLGLGTQGVIHLTRQVAILAMDRGVIDVVDDKLVTALGTPVVAGVGYDPSLTPAVPAFAPVPLPAALGPQPDTQYGFATGPVYVHLGAPKSTGEYFDHETNTLSVLADRPAAVYWDSCATLAVVMDANPS